MSGPQSRIVKSQMQSPTAAPSWMEFKFRSTACNADADAKLKLGEGRKMVEAMMTTLYEEEWMAILGRMYRNG